MKNREAEKKYQVRKILKKGAGITLCAALAGTAAAGAFAAAGWKPDVLVQAAIKDDGQVTLLNADEDAEPSAGKGSLDVSDIVQKAMPSVVSITTKSIQEVQDYFYGFFNYGGYGYAPQQREVEGSASGIIIGKNEEQLLVATNYHVIEGATTLSISFIDGNVCEAQPRGYDEYRDIAVVAVDLDDISDETMDQISVATIGSSDDLLVGEQVVAIGNALGYGQSVTTGIVSAKNRRLNGNSVSDSDSGVNLIQTDAAINPGNSGGALLNMNGEVVGINSSKLASTEVEGMCYAIAISDVKDILEDLMNETPREKIEDGSHGVLGITGTTVSSEAGVYGIPQGVFVTEVTEGGAADKAGIKKNSVITQVNNRVITSIDALVDLLKYYKPGEEVEIVLQELSSDGYTEKTVTVTLDENPDANKEDANSDSDKNGGNIGKSSGNDNGDNGNNGDSADDSERDYFDDWANDDKSDILDDFFW